MKPPAMCPACEREVGMTFLRSGSASAVLLHGKDPCPHVVRFHGIEFVPDPECPEGLIQKHSPHPLVEMAYRIHAAKGGK